MGKKFTVGKEAGCGWYVIRENESKVFGPFHLKKEATDVAERYNRIHEYVDAGSVAPVGKAENVNNNEKNADLPPAPGNKQTKKTTVAAAPTPAPAQLQCACGWIVVPAVAYKHFENCPILREL